MNSYTLLQSQITIYKWLCITLSNMILKKKKKKKTRVT